MNIIIRKKNKNKNKKSNIFTNNINNNNYKQPKNKSIILDLTNII